MEIGRILKRKRMERNLTLTQLADLSGVSQSSISDIEADKRSPTINTLEKMCEAMHIPIQEILPYSEYSELSKNEHDVLELIRKLSDEEKEHLFLLFTGLLKNR